MQEGLYRQFWPVKFRSPLNRSQSPQVSEVLPLLYLHGLSSGDFVPALGQFLGTGAGLPPR
jgi:hypothetical protein